MRNINSFFASPFPLQLLHPQWHYSSVGSTHTNVKALWPHLTQKIKLKIPETDTFPWHCWLEILPQKAVCSCKKLPEFKSIILGFFFRCILHFSFRSQMRHLVFYLLFPATTTLWSRLVWGNDKPKTIQWPFMTQDGWEPDCPCSQPTMNNHITHWLFA